LNPAAQTYRSMCLFSIIQGSFVPKKDDKNDGEDQ
jgi:hypothetical protein